MNFKAICYLMKIIPFQNTSQRRAVPCSAQHARGVAGRWAWMEPRVCAVSHAGRSVFHAERCANATEHVRFIGSRSTGP